MEPNLESRLASLEVKIDAMYRTVDKLRKYFLWTGIITIALFVLPLIGLVFAIPTFLNSYANIGNFDSTSGSNAPASTNSLNELNSLLGQ